MKYKDILYVCSILLVFHSHGESKIILFLRPYPTFFAARHAQEVYNKITKPGAIARRNYKLLANKPFSVAGVPALYGGLVTFSNVDGLIEFPLLHLKPEITLVITTKVTPIIMSGNTIHHWELEEGTPADTYIIKQEKNEITQLQYVTVEPTTLPENKHLRPETLILIARPQNIYIPLGASLSESSVHFFIPDIYLKKSPDPLLPLYILQISQYFGLLIQKHQQQSLKYSSQLNR